MPDVRLVIIDPLFRFVKSTDANDYAKMIEILAPVLEVGRKNDVHILATHHMKKKDVEDAQDGALGSTAIAGTVDATISIGKRNGNRIISSTNRAGVPFPETFLNWKEDTREFSLGPSVDVAAAALKLDTERRIEAAIIDFVAKLPGAPQEAIFGAVPGNTATKKRVFQSLKESGMFVESGTGKRGDPYKYTLAPLPMETIH